MTAARDDAEAAVPLRSCFKALAVDYDGTLTRSGPPSTAVLGALERARKEGLRLILVTGRILAELRHEFPGVADHFDALVGENGAVLQLEGVSRALTASVPVGLDEALVRRGIPFRRGQVLLACDGEHDVAVLEDLRRLGLECQLSRNREQLMVLPSGITKGGGVVEALAQLGLSRHSAVAVGDAENDLSLLEACEIGVAVDNAVPSLKQLADVVLGEADGAGVAGLLTGPILRDELRVEPRRWQVDLGRTALGEAVTIPGSRVNVLITGGSGSGKSYAAGFLAERLIALGYSVCVFDPEGDHAPLGRLHNVVVVGGREALPSPAHLTRILRQGLGSVVVDLSLARAERDAYMRDALAALTRLRADAGVPHWIFLDEAQDVPGAEDVSHIALEPEGRGFCLVSYRPAEVCARARNGFDFLLALPGEHGIEPAMRASLVSACGVDARVLDPELTGVGIGQAVLVRKGSPPRTQVLALAPRWVAHVRHWHKYAGAVLPKERRFYFRHDRGLTGVTAANLAEFHHELRRCGEEVLRHHAAGHDFSRWIQDVIQDSTLAAEARSLESSLVHATAEQLEDLRAEFLESIELRYLG